MAETDKQKPASSRTAKHPEHTGRDLDAGAALRTVYQKTVDEEIPSEMLDLLGKLG